MRVSLLICLSLLIGFPGFTQTAERLDDILAQDELSVRSAAYVAAASGGLIGDEESPDEALAALEGAGFRVRAGAPERPVRLDEFSHMLMVAHDGSGGILYTLFSGPRYALRELRHERVIRGRGDPNDPVSGTRALRLTERLMTVAETEG